MRDVAIIASEINCSRINVDETINVQAYQIELTVCVDSLSYFSHYHHKVLVYFNKHLCATDALVIFCSLNNVYFSTPCRLIVKKIV